MQRTCLYTLLPGEPSEGSTRKAQRITIPMGSAQHLADDDSVIARIMRRRLPALKTGQRSGDDRYTFIVQFPVKIIESAAVAGEAGAQHVLIGAQHMNGEMGRAAEGLITRRAFRR